MGDKSPMHHFLQSSVLILIVSCGNGRVTIGYRLGIDWITIGARLNQKKSITEFRLNIDQNLTQSKPRGGGKVGCSRSSTQGVYPCLWSTTPSGFIWINRTV